MQNDPVARSADGSGLCSQLLHRPWKCSIQGKDGHMLTLASVKLLTSKCSHTHRPATGLTRQRWLINQKTDSMTTDDGCCTENCNEKRAGYVLFDDDLMINNVVLKESIFLLI